MDYNERSMNLYSIYDNKAEVHGPIFMAVNDEVAIRNYRNFMSSVRSWELSDYNLVFVGIFDEKTGYIKGTVRNVDITELIQKGVEHYEETTVKNI